MEIIQKWNIIILKNLNLELYKGDRILICGKSGSGKTTLVKEVSNGDDNDVVDQDILPTESTRFGQACIRVLSVLDNNPVEKFDARDVSKNALDCLYLVEIYKSLARRFLDA